MGSGTLNEDGSKIPVTATGSVSGDAVKLHIWTVVSEYGNKIDKSTDLDLVQADKTVSGSYQLYSGEETIGSGNATASRAAA
jgi:predicted metal-dependent peptidase